MAHSNVIDTPRPAGAEDLLGVDRYVEALVRFISTAEMPTTLAIQGEWGSGKTSLMNQVRFSLCEMPGTPDVEKQFYGIWINTWQYSLMKSPDGVLLSVIQGITAEVTEIMQRRHQSKVDVAIQKVSGLFGKLAKAGAKAAVNAVGVDSGVVDDIMNEGAADKTTISAFRQALSDAINQCLAEDAKAGNQTRGFLFFIDDLDRLDPAVAVQILELLKNLFEVENCIFVLAIDYEVVVKGLEPKFGLLTEKNEREFRSFFDKIIQLPFAMPVNSYRIDTYLRNALSAISYYTYEELDSTTAGTPLLSTLSDMVQLSTGSNPRSVKRLINTLSLIQIIYQTHASNEGFSATDKLLGFALVCVQIAYPPVYNMLLFEPNFKNWDDSVAKRYRAPSLADGVSEHLLEAEEFDEEWEQVLYRVCQNNAYLVSRSFSVFRLLNLVADTVGADRNLGLEVEKMLGVAAVTTVSAPGNESHERKGYERVRLDSLDDFYAGLLAQQIPVPMIDMAKEVLIQVQGTFKDTVRMEINPRSVSVVVVKNKSRERKLLSVQPRKRDLLLQSVALNGYLGCKPSGEHSVPEDLLARLCKLFETISEDNIPSGGVMARHLC